MTPSVLHSLRSRLAGWLALAAVLLLLAGLGGGVLAFVLADAALDLSESLRVATPWLLGAGAAVFLAGAALRIRRLTEDRLAAQFERSNAALGSKLTNAVQLARAPGATAVESFLRSEAVALGRSAAQKLRAWPLSRRGVLMGAGGAAAVAFAWLLLATTGGDMLRAVWPRFADPRGDHPPFSRLRLEVTPREAEVLYGGQVEVRAKASGVPVDKLWLVATSASNETRAIMFLAPDKSFFQTLANLREPATFHVTDGRARSLRFPIRIRYTPQITLVELTTTFPEYTALAPRTAKLADEAQALPAGTRVAFRVASNRPLKSGTLTLTPVLGGKPVEVALMPAAEDSSSNAPAHLVTGGFTLKEPVAFTLSVRDTGGLDCAEPRRGRFNLQPDQRPHIFVLEPGRDAVATPSFRVPVRVQADDDFGIARVVWLRGLNRSIERPFAMVVVLKRGAQSVEASGAFELAKLGVRPGDVVDYYFEAADNFPQGPNIALSRIYRLEVISEEQYKEILRQAAARKALFEPYFQLGNWLRRMAERARQLEQKALAGKPADEAPNAKEAGALADDLEKYLRELGKLGREAAMFDVEQAFRETLGLQHTAGEQVQKELRAALAGGTLDPRKMSEVADKLAELAQTEREEVGDPAQRIAAVAALLARADTFVKLAQEQAALAQLLRRFAERTNELSRLEQMELQSLAEREQRIKDATRALMESLPELLGKLPPEAEFDPLRNDVNAFLQAVEEARIEQMLGEAHTKIAEPEPPAGYALAQLAAEAMDKLVQKSCNGLPKQGQQCLRFQPKLQQAMGNTLQQILAAMGAGNGGDGQSGFTWFNNNVGLYGPNMEMAGDQGGGGREIERAGGGGPARVAGGPGEDDQPPTGSAARLKLQPDAKFPLRYRDLVGDYFRAIAESEAQKGAGR